MVYPEAIYYEKDDQYDEYIILLQNACDEDNINAITEILDIMYDRYTQYLYEKSIYNLLIYAKKNEKIKTVQYIETAKYINNN